MAKLTIGRMAKLYGLHRSSLHEAVAKGRVSAEFDGKGQKVVDLAEMIRVYGEPSGATRHLPTPAPDIPPTLPIEALQPLLNELRLLREEVRELRETLHLLEHKPDPPPALPPSEKPANPKPQEPASWSSLLEALND